MLHTGAALNAGGSNFQLGKHRRKIIGVLVCLAACLHGVGHHIHKMLIGHGDIRDCPAHLLLRFHKPLVIRSGNLEHLFRCFFTGRGHLIGAVRCALGPIADQPVIGLIQCRHKAAEFPHHLYKILSLKAVHFGFQIGQIGFAVVQVGLRHIQLLYQVALLLAIPFSSGKRRIHLCDLRFVQGNLLPHQLDLLAQVALYFLRLVLNISIRFQGFKL